MSGKKIKNKACNTVACLAAALGIAICTGTAMASAPVKLNARLDSVQLTQGSKATVSLSVNGYKPGAAFLPELKERSVLADGVEISSIKADTTTMVSGRLNIDYTIGIQAFNPGTVPIAPIAYIEDGDTSFSDPMVLKVMEVDLDTLSTINPMAGNETIESRWYDWIPDWWIWVALGLAVILTGFAVYFFLLRKDRAVVIKRVRKVIPPYELAMRRLNALQSKDLISKGSEREYYTELTDILRQYLGGRFGINALEMTSTEIMHKLRENNEARPDSPLVQEVLRVADFVKFAKVRPLPDDNVKAFASARRFIENTRPLPEPDQSRPGNAGTPAEPGDKGSSGTAGASVTGLKGHN